MSWIQPLSEDFLYSDPEAIASELYRVHTDEPLTTGYQAPDSSANDEPEKTT